jgi:hypothetical protein
MSDNTNNFALFNVEVPESIDNATKNLTDKPTKQIGQTLSDCLYLVFGGISHAARKRELQYAQDLDLFASNLAKKVDAIPVDKRIEPDIQTVCPALENAKYCVGSEELRTLFSNLIASSMNSDTVKFVHPSFGEIIKQMSPLDARIFSTIMKNNLNPIMHVKEMKPTGGYVYLCKYLNLYDASTHELTCNTIENLCRLNLIEIPADGFYTNEAVYQILRDRDMYNDLVLYPQNTLGLNIEEEKKYIEKTSIGLAFAKVCLCI